MVWCATGTGGLIMAHWSHGLGMFWWAGLLVGGVMIAWFLAHPSRGVEPADDAEALLRRSYALGEIDDAEYYDRLALLRDTEL